MRAIFGADPYTSGEVYIKGERAEIKSLRMPCNTVWG